MTEYPKINEFIICKISKVTNFGVFVELLEYDNIEGFVHVSQISSSWVKNIHNHVKLNQIRAAKVLKIDTHKNHIDLSFNRVAPSDEKRKISDYRLFKRAQGLLTTVSKQTGISQNDLWTKIADPLLSVDKNLYTGFINLLKYGVDKYPMLDKEIALKVIDVLEKNITIKNKIITKTLKISCLKENGVEIIKEGCTKVLKKNKVEIDYVGPGKYTLRTTGIDYKEASKEFNNTVENLQKNLKECEFSVVDVNKK
jgi:translation initiation factor 2 subunit 1